MIIKVLAPDARSSLPPLQVAIIRPREARIWAALAEAVAPALPVIPDAQGRVLAFLSGLLPAMAPLSRRMLRVGLWLFELGTILSFFALRPFSSLPRGRRLEYIKRWQDQRSWLRLCFLALRTPVAMAFYDLREVRERLGYDLAPYVADRIAARAKTYGRTEPPVTEPHDVAQPHPSAAPAPAVGPPKPGGKRDKSSLPPSKETSA